MTVQTEKINNLDPGLVQLINSAQTFTFRLVKGDMLYERKFTRTGSSLDNSIISFSHQKITYQIYQTSNGNTKRVIDKKDMPSTSTISQRVFQTIHTLLNSGYYCVEFERGKEV